MTCRTNKAGKKLCKPYNDARGCKNAKCPEVHSCDVLMASGYACDNPEHNRVNHRGATIPL